jgi:hypothetical protein
MFIGELEKQNNSTRSEDRKKKEDAQVKPDKDAIRDLWWV